MHRVVIAALGLSLLATSAVAQRPPPEGHADARIMLERLVAFETVAGRGAVPPMADYIAGELRQAGFDPADIEILPVGETAALMLRYRGPADAARRPVVFLAHMDVVDARHEDWTRDPWTLTEADGSLYGRGVVDNKYGLLTLVQAFIRLKREGFAPDRDLVLALSGDEETGMQTTRLLAERLRGAEFAINADAGGGFRSADGRQTMYAVQAAEKTYATFEVTTRNSGGHSSSPRPDNAIYQLSDALKRLEGHRFPVRWNPVSLAGFAGLAPSVEGPVGEALTRFVAAPGDPAAVAVLEAEPWIDRELRTTCVATMLRAGHAENALPTSATATVNCRIFPGETIDSIHSTLKDVIADPAIEVSVLDEPLESPVSEVPAELTAALAKVLAVRAPGAAMSPYMEAGGTDGLHFRRAGVATIGAGPLFSAEGVDYNYHGNDERLPVAHFHDGLDHFYLLIKALAGPD